MQPRRSGQEVPGEEATPDETASGIRRLRGRDGSIRNVRRKSTEHPDSAAGPARDSCPHPGPDCVSDNLAGHVPGELSGFVDR